MTTGLKELSRLYSEEMETKKPEEVTEVVICIDFRKVEQGRKLLQTQGVTDGDYHLLATAGAARNKDTLSMVNPNEHDHHLSSLINLSHKDCGYAKKQGDDSEQAHENSMQELGQSLKKVNQDLQYSPFLLPVRNGDLEKHHCKAVAIMLGKPSIVKKARQELDRLGLTNNHDEIARPFNLDPKDESIWQDLNISLQLHEPSRILIFDENEENVRILVEKASQMAAGIEIEPKVVNQAA